jgi:hypothetical protein
LSGLAVGEAAGHGDLADAAGIPACEPVDRYTPSLRRQFLVGCLTAGIVVEAAPRSGITGKTKAKHGDRGGPRCAIMRSKPLRHCSWLELVEIRLEVAAGRFRIDVLGLPHGLSPSFNF